MSRVPYLLVVSLGLFACAGDEYSILIDARSEADVEALQIQLVSLSRRPGSVRNGARRILRTREDIQNGEPIRVAVSLDQPDQVMVHLVGTANQIPVVLASRCYDVVGVVRDSLTLVLPSAAEDPDGDGYPEHVLDLCKLADGTLCDEHTPHVCTGVALDCDPNDDAVHLGATDFCDDGTDQNCIAGDAPCGDRDGDGWDDCSSDSPPGACDCDDDNPAVFPGASETIVPEDGTCDDGIDQNCDAIFLACDRDGDGYPAGQDCNDANPNVHPGMPELCTADGQTPVDENCNGITDELAECEGDDLDRDGFDVCTAAGQSGCDCNDCNPGIHPGRTEVCGNSVDEDCSGADLPCAAEDADADGWSTDRDCLPNDPRANPTSFDNCNTAGVDESCAQRPCQSNPDSDGDGFAEPIQCEDNSDITPFTPEVCDGQDQDCNGITDDIPPGNTGCGYDRRDTSTCSNSGACTINFATNFFHCGSCRAPCERDTADRCLAGSCDCSSQPGTSACASGTTCCTGTRGGGCRNLQSDHEYCGSCDTSCATLAGTADRCVNGRCSCGSQGSPCAAGSICCGGSCFNPQTDLNHCGSCSNACDLPRAVEVCRAGNCEIAACDAGWADCAGGAANGCETRLGTVSNCRACGDACVAEANATTSCGPSGCTHTCRSTHGDCNGDLGAGGNGCETLLGTVSNCRACGDACVAEANATTSCGPSGCTHTCRSTHGDCDGNLGTGGNGCETSLTSKLNCGACNAACTGASMCSPSRTCCCGPSCGAVGAGGAGCLGLLMCCPGNLCRAACP